MGGAARGPGGRAHRQRRAKPCMHVCDSEAHGGHCRGGPRRSGGLTGQAQPRGRAGSAEPSR
eukprot:11542051-Alexandrium_andersonii.AAC.1